MDKLDAIDCLVANRIHLLLQLRETPQPNQRTAAGNAERHRPDSLGRLAPAAFAKGARWAGAGKAEQSFGAFAQRLCIGAKKRSPRGAYFVDRQIHRAENFQFLWS